jgi:hypothetical protein
VQISEEDEGREWRIVVVFVNKAPEEVYLVFLLLEFVDCGDGKKRHPLRRSSSSCCRRRSLVHSSKTMTMTSVQRRLIALLALAGVSFTFFPWTYLDGWASSTCSSCGCTTRIVIHCLEEEEALATPVYIAIREIHGNSRPF